MNGAEPPRVVGEFPWSLGGAAEVLHRRRIGVGVDRRGQVVLARPDSIQVDFGGDERQRDSVATLVNKADCSEPDATEWDEAEATGVLTVRLDPEERNGRWQLGRLDAELSRFHDEGSGPSSTTSSSVPAPPSRRCSAEQSPARPHHRRRRRP